MWLLEISAYFPSAVYCFHICFTSLRHIILSVDVPSPSCTSLQINQSYPACQVVVHIVILAKLSYLLLTADCCCLSVSTKVSMNGHPRQISQRFCLYLLFVYWCIVIYRDHRKASAPLGIGHIMESQTRHSWQQMLNTFIMHGCVDCGHLQIFCFAVFNMVVCLETPCTCHMHVLLHWFWKLA